MGIIIAFVMRRKNFPADLMAQVNSFPLQQLVKDLDSLSNGERIWEAMRRLKGAL